MRASLQRALGQSLIERFGRTPAGRMRAAGALSALGVLLSRHPRAAVDMLGAGIWEAGRTGLRDLGERWAPRESRDRPPAEPPAKRKRASKRALRRLRKVLDKDARRARKAPADQAKSPGASLGS